MWILARYGHCKTVITLEQDLRSLEDYVQEYLEIAYYSDLPDCVLICFFCEGINQTLKSRLTLEGPRLSLSDYMDYALWFSAHCGCREGMQHRTHSCNPHWWAPALSAPSCRSPALSAPPWRSSAPAAPPWWAPVPAAPPWWAPVLSAPPWWAPVSCAQPWWAPVSSAPSWWAPVSSAQPWWAPVSSAPPWWAPVLFAPPWYSALPALPRFLVSSFHMDLALRPSPGSTSSPPPSWIVLCL